MTSQEYEWKQREHWEQVKGGLILEQTEKGMTNQLWRKFELILAGIHLNIVSHKFSIWRNTPEHCIPQIFNMKACRVSTTEITGTFNEQVCFHMNITLFTVAVWTIHVLKYNILWQHQSTYLTFLLFKKVTGSCWFFIMDTEHHQMSMCSSEVPIAGMDA